MRAMVVAARKTHASDVLRRTRRDEVSLIKPAKAAEVAYSELAYRRSSRRHHLLQSDHLLPYLLCWLSA